MANDSNVWVWIEPIGFDSALPDYGVGRYLARAGFPLKGVSLLMTALDFILLHDGMETERTLWPDACSRRAHERNQERDRQAWTTWQIRGLVEEFHRRGVLVYLSVFRYYLENAWHHEWMADHPEDREWLTEHGDGTRFEDIFVPKLERVMLDYGFDGWHAADSQCGSGTIARHLLTDNFLRAFLRECPQEGLDAARLAPCGGDQARMQARGEYLWRKCRFDLMEFTSRRWESFLRKAASMLHAHGRKLMCNSNNATSLLDCKYHCGLDYRRLPACGVDIFVVETVATSLHLVYGHEDTVFNLAASLGELKAALPGVELVLLTGVMDVVESFDAFQHAPARLLRDTYTLANQTFAENGAIARAADGFMICLGDIADPHNWEMLDRMRVDNWGFEVAGVEGLTAVYDPGIYDRLCRDYDRHGTVPPYLHASALMRNGVELHHACAVSELARLDGRPVLVAEFDQFDAARQAAILARKGVTVLTGNFHAGIPEGASAFTCRILPDYLFGCVVLGGEKGERRDFPAPTEGAAFDSLTPFRLVRDLIPMMRIPEALWEAAARFIAAAVAPDGAGLAFCNGDLYAIAQSAADGRRRVAICSDVTRYEAAQYRFRRPYPQAVDNPRNFPCYPFVAAPEDGLLKCAGNSVHVFGRLVVPPKGILLAEAE